MEFTIKEVIVFRATIFLNEVLRQVVLEIYETFNIITVQI